MRCSLRLTGEQHDTIKRHLFPGDGKEAVVLLLCGRRSGTERHIFTAQKVTCIPYDSCTTRSRDRVTWPTDLIDPLISEAYGREKAIVKMHSHTERYRSFSATDDASDIALFTSIANLLDNGLPHASLIMLPSGELFGRAFGPVGEVLAAIDTIMVVGDDLRIWPALGASDTPAFAERHAQAFGRGTIARLGRLSAAVVGCSGTGSVVVEQLARLGIGELVLIDPDLVEERNLNRILNATRFDIGRPKVEVLADALARIGLGQRVTAIDRNLACRDAVLAAAECDILFGCMDGIEGRHLLNRIATFYVMPYFDLGVRLDVDGAGGVATVAGAVHYIQPGRSSLLSREVYSLKQLEAEEMRRANPHLYEQQRHEGYLRGIQEDRPAVISANMLFAALAVNDFLARLHPYRNLPNSRYAYIGGDLSEFRLMPEPEGDSCPLLAPFVGRGDTMPLLNRPTLS